MKKLSLIGVTLFVAFLMVSCIGPQGPVGPQGPEGNANVVSQTVTVYPMDWYWDYTSWRVDIEYGAITTDITDYGAVLVYMDNAGTWRQIPFTFYYEAEYDDGSYGFCSSSLEVSTYDKGVSIFWTESDFYAGFRPEEHNFKIVVIAASVYNSRADIDYSDYEAVKRAYQLAD